MGTGSNKYFILVTALFVALTAHLGARLASQLISANLSVGEHSEATISKKRSRATVAPRLADYRIIENRNLFNANPKPKQPEKTLNEESEEVETPSVEPSELNVILTATGVRSQGVSFAIFEVEGTSKLIRVGEEVAEGARLTEVRPDRVYVNNNGRREEIKLFGREEEEDTRRRPPIRSTLRRPRPSRRDVSPDSSTEDTIRQVSDTAWVIDRREVDDAISNMSKLITQIRVVPNLGGDGQADGFKIFSIRPASIFAKIGLSNGDIVKEINNSQLNSIEQAYEAFSQLQGASSIQVNLVRRNQPLTLSYDIR